MKITFLGTAAANAFPEAFCKCRNCAAKNPVAIAVNPLTNKIYVANSASNNVTVIDGAHD